MDRMEAENRRAKIDLQKDVMRSRDEMLEENWETIQKVLEDAAGKVAHSTKNERQIVKRTLENVRTRAEAAARCTEVIKRGVFKKQARKARAEPLPSKKRKYTEIRCRSCMSTGTSRKTEKNGKKRTAKALWRGVH